MQPYKSYPYWLRFKLLDTKKNKIEDSKMPVLLKNEQSYLHTFYHPGACGSLYPVKIF